MPSRPEGPCGRLARFGRAEEQIKKRLDRDFAALRIGQGGVLAVFRILWRLTSARAGASEYETADQLGTAERKGLRDVSADGEAQQIDLCKSEGADEIGGVVGHRIDRVRGLSGRRGNPAVHLDGKPATPRRYTRKRGDAGQKRRVALDKVEKVLSGDAE